MALYDVSVGTLPQASDVSQLVDIFNGYHDIGQITFAPQVVAPTTTGFSLLAQSGSTLGVGAYNYQFSYVTGYYKSDGTLVVTGETTVSPALPITTASGSTTVKVTLPLPGPISIVATRIYRTAVGGSTYGLIATIKDGSTTYTDSTADGSRGAAPSVSNTTGTNLTVNGDVKVGAVAATANPLQLIVQNWSTAAAGSAQIIGGWQGANYWGIGTDSSSGDLTVQIGNTNITGVWQATNITLKVAGGITSVKNTLDDGSGNLTTFGTITTAGINIEAWNGITLQNAWINTGGVYALARYRKDKHGVVWLQGRIQGGTTTSGTLLFTLPAGYRPISKLSFTVVTNNTSADQVGQIDIDTTGNVYLIVGYNTYLTLDQIAFHTT